MAIGAYSIYKKNIKDAEEKQLRFKQVEEDYIAKNLENLVKLQNFNKQVYAIGVYDEYYDTPELAEMKKTDEWKKKLI